MCDDRTAGQKKKMTVTISRSYFSCSNSSCVVVVVVVVYINSIMAHMELIKKGGKAAKKKSFSLLFLQNKGLCADLLSWFY